MLSAGSLVSAASAGSILSAGSAGSILSLGSVGSILSVGSVNSILSVGSFGSVLSLRSYCSVLAKDRSFAIGSERPSRPEPGKGGPTLRVLSTIALVAMCLGRAR